MKWFIHLRRKFRALWLLITRSQEVLDLLDSYDADHQRFSRRIREATKLIKARTEIHTDISYTRGGPNTIIICGRYRKRDYIEMFSIYDQHMDHLIRMLREMQRYGEVRHVDAPIEISAVIKREMKQ